MGQIQEDDPAAARKRRKAILTLQRHEEEDDGNASPGKKAKKEQHHLSGKKRTQVRYDPEVPMSKEQLAAWRREARRVRNRESAAASRQRIRNRIAELEEEVSEWKSKYIEASARLDELKDSNSSAARSMPKNDVASGT